MSSETVTKRLHVGGITPNITLQHLKDRFASFGKVQTVDELAPDALGQKRPFLYITIETTAPQLKKCLNIMSGSMWRGTQLRIAEAKPSWSERLAKEKNPRKEDEELRLRKRKRRQRTISAAAGIGKEAQDMRMVTHDNYMKKKFWTLTPSDHLVRPIAMRPSHPIPLLPSTNTAGPSKRVPPTRARRRVLNPTLWNPTHKTEGEISVDGTHAEEGEWEWHQFEEDEELVDGPDEEDAEHAIGAWKRVKDGAVLEEQVVRVKRRRLGQEIDVEEDDESDLEVASETSGSDLFGRRPAASREASPLFGNRTQAPVAGDDEELSSRSSSPFFMTDRERLMATDNPMAGQRNDDEDPVIEVEYDETDEDQDEEEKTEEAEESRPKIQPSSPLFAARAVPVLEIESQSNNDTPGSIASEYPPSPIPPPQPKQAIPSRPKVNVPDPLRKQVLAEQSRDLSLLSSILTGANAFGDEMEISRQPFAGFSESDDEDEPAEGEVLRLRGGMPNDTDDDEDMSSEEESSAESDSESSSSSSSDSTSSASSDSDFEAEEGDSKQAQPPKQSGTSMSSRPLKDMFAPTSSAFTSGGFSLMASLDPDLELDELDVPLAPSVRPATTEELLPLEPLQAGPSVSGLFDSDPSIPLFFPTLSSFGGVDSGKKGKDGYAEDMQKEDWRGFWRVEGETDEGMKEIWEKEKLELTRDWKKRHREAKKHRKRRGGVEEVE